MIFNIITNYLYSINRDRYFVVIVTNRVSILKCILYIKVMFILMFVSVFNINCNIPIYILLCVRIHFVFSISTLTIIDLSPKKQASENL